MLLRLRLVMSLACLALHAAVEAHPHISKQQALEQLDQVRSSLEAIAKLHGGKPALDHPDAERWRDLRLRLAECRLLLGNPQEAAAICDAVIAQWPAFADSYSLRRACRLSLGDRAGAHKDTLRYLELGAGNPWLVIEHVDRPVSPDDPHAAADAYALRFQLVQQARTRWPDNPALAQRAIRLADATKTDVVNIAKAILGNGPDPVRTAVVSDIIHTLGTEKGRFVLSSQLKALPPPEIPKADDRLSLALACRRAGLHQFTIDATTETLKHIEAALIQFEGETAAEHERLALLAVRARALAILGKWTEASEAVAYLFERHHNQRVWFNARIACAVALGDQDAETLARSQWREWFTDVGIQPPKEPDIWP